MYFKDVHWRSCSNGAGLFLSHFTWTNSFTKHWGKKQQLLDQGLLSFTLRLFGTQQSFWWKGHLPSDGWNRAPFDWFPQREFQWGNAKEFLHASLFSLSLPCCFQLLHEVTLKVCCSPLIFKMRFSVMAQTSNSIALLDFEYGSKSGCLRIRDWGLDGKTCTCSFEWVLLIQCKTIIGQLAKCFGRHDWA